MSTKAKYQEDESHVEINEEIKQLLERFSSEEIETGVIQTGRHPAEGEHSAQDIHDAYRKAIIEDTIGDLISRIRKLHGHSLKTTADIVGVSRGRVHQLEQSDVNLRIDTLQRVAHSYKYKVQVKLVPEDSSKETLMVELPD